MNEFTADLLAAALTFVVFVLIGILVIGFYWVFWGFLIVAILAAFLLFCLALTLLVIKIGAWMWNLKVPI